MAMEEIRHKIEDRVHPNQTEGGPVPIVDPVEEKNHGAYVVSDPMDQMTNQHHSRKKIKSPLPAREPVSRRCLVAPRRQHQIRDHTGNKNSQLFGFPLIR